MLSLKVVAELPIIVVLMYQLYKQNVHQDVAEFIPLIMVTITLQPSQQVSSRSQLVSDGSVPVPARLRWVNSLSRTG